MGTRLCRLKAQLKGQILSDGKCLRGKNRLTEHEIDNLQSCYGPAIRRNHSSVQNMRQAIWAIFLHKLSTDEYPQHDFFVPSGKIHGVDLKRLKHQRLPTSFKRRSEIISNYESNSCNFCVKNVLSGIFDTLTPGHFLVGRPIPAIAEPSLTEVNDNRLKVWQKQTKIVQQIFKRWSNNYLNTLQNRNKLYFEKNNVKIHDMVILKEDNLPVCNWPLGRNLEVYHGKDNKIRVVLYSEN
ncbi:integrase catalytic domain-containing protein [Trichonephila clavipes]|nr:integrase catalytic domain-containing protein [Trichonephila clavipes]